MKYFLVDGYVPDTFKRAVAIALIKKVPLPRDEFESHCCVSGLFFISKLVEPVTTQLIDHVNSNNLDNPLQSAYKGSHPTETALLSQTMMSKLSWLEVSPQPLYCLVYQQHLTKLIIPLFSAVLKHHLVRMVQH